jgi:hypothetical protein
MESKTKSQRNVKKMRENEEANGTKSNAMRLKWKWKNDLGVLINGGNEIGEEIKAEKWLRRFVSR